MALVPSNVLAYLYVDINTQKSLLVLFSCKTMSHRIKFKYFFFCIYITLDPNHNFWSTHFIRKERVHHINQKECDLIFNFSALINVIWRGRPKQQYHNQHLVQHVSIKLFWVRLNYATTHNDLPPSTTAHHQLKYNHHHPPSPTNNQIISTTIHQISKLIQLRRCFIRKTLKFFIQQ